MYFVATTEGLTQLFRNNIWKLHRLPESMASDRRPHSAAELIKEFLKKMLGIETKLLTLFHPQINGQTEQMNQELEQYLWFFVNHRQKNWPEQLAMVEFVVNNKTHSVTKVSQFIANYGRKLRIEADIRKKEKVEKATEFAERIKKV